MTTRTLLYDSGCASCAGIADEIQRHDLTNGGRLELQSLRNPEMKRLLDETHPDGWPWEPTLVEVQGDGSPVRTWTGVRLIPRLISTIGVRRAHAIARLVNDRTADSGPTDPGRRSALLKIGAAAAAVPLLSLGIGLGNAAAEQTAGGTELTDDDARKAYHTLRTSPKYRDVVHEAEFAGYHLRSSGKLHRQSGFASPTFTDEGSGGITLLGEHAGQRVCVILLAYHEQYPGTSQATERAAWMVAYVDLKNEDVLTVFHQETTVDANGQIIEATAVDSRGVRGRRQANGRWERENSTSTTGNNSLGRIDLGHTSEEVAPASPCEGEIVCFWASQTTCITICTLVSIVVAVLSLGWGSVLVLSCSLVCETSWFFLCDTVEC